MVLIASRYGLSPGSRSGPDQLHTRASPTAGHAVRRRLRPGAAVPPFGQPETIRHRIASAPGAVASLLDRPSALSGGPSPCGRLGVSAVPTAAGRTYGVEEQAGEEYGADDDGSDWAGQVWLVRGLRCWWRDDG